MEIARLWRMPAFDDAPTARSGEMVQRLSLTLALTALLWFAASWLVLPEFGNIRFIGLAAGAFLVGCSLVARHGWPRLAAWILVTAVWATGMLVVLVRADLSPGFGCFLVAILAAGVLLGGGAALATAGAGLAASGAYVWMGMPRILDPVGFAPSTAASVWIAVAAYVLAAGTLLWVGLAQLRQALRRAESGEQRVELLAQRGLDIFWSVEGDGRVTYVSPSVEPVLGYSPEEQMQRVGTLAMLDEETAPEARRAVGAALRRGGGPFRYEARHRRKDGGSRWCEVTGVAIATADGSLASLHGVTRDISDRKRAEAERDALEMQLRQSQKMEAIGRLAGGIAHDFNNYLTVIQTRADDALEATPDGPVHQALAEIRAAGDHSADLVRQILVLGRRRVTRPKTLDPNELVGRMTGLLSRLLGEDVELEAVLGEGVGCVRADAPQLEQVLLNLAVNARDAMPDGGRLTISTGEVSLAPGDASRAGLDAGSYVKLTVRDTGTGIDAASRQHIFEPFFTTKPPEQSSGLGLSTVYGIVQQCGGSVTVRSQPGRGAEFTVLLPREEGRPEAPGTEQRSHAPERGAPSTILLVEDLEMLRQATRAVLERQGYTVLEAAGGAEALELERGYEGTIHLLVTDLLMPRQSGFELAKELRRLRPDLRVLYMSGFSRAPNPDARWELDAPLLEKPFVSADLLGKVQQALGRTPASTPPSSVQEEVDSGRQASPPRG